MHLVILFGPPAAGKMTVGQEIAARTTYRLFHNHLSIEPFLGVFDYGTPSFLRLRDLVRERVLAEAIEADLPGLIFTFVWALDLPGDAVEVARLVEPFLAGGHRVDFVELTADLDTCLSREGTANRLGHKRSKADVAWATEHNRELHSGYVFTTARMDPPVDMPGPHLVVDNGAGRSAADTAQEIIERLALPVAPGHSQPQGPTLFGTTAPAKEG